MLLNDYIKIKVNTRNLKYLKDLGYSVEKCGSEITILTKELQKGSSVKVNVKCDICGKEKLLTFKTYSQNIKNSNLYCCSEKCSNIKREKTNLKKYGKKYQVLTENFKKKSKLTKKEKYGNEKYTNREKFIETCNNRYECNNVFQLEEVKNKSKNTKKEKYGDENFRNVKKQRKTKKEKYGDINYNNPEKREKTCLERYGVKSFLSLVTDRNNKHNNYKNVIKQWFIDNPKEREKRSKWMASNEFKEKSKNTVKEKYGVDHVMHIDSVVLKNHLSGFWSKKYKDTNLYYRGSYEFDFLEKYFDKLNISNAKSISYIFKNKKRRYFPDFYIKELNLLIEIKSTYTYEKDFNKNIAKQEESINKGFNHIIIIDKDYSKFDKIINMTK